MARKARKEAFSEVTNRAQQYTSSAVQVLSALQAMQLFRGPTAERPTYMLTECIMHSFGAGHGG